MRMIFIRHGDPDYENDTLTKKGWKEAALLAKRVADWPVTDFYCSPLGRARDTASLSLEVHKREAVVYDWMKEFYYPITDPSTGRYGVPWDFMPRYWTENPLFYDKDHWFEAEIFASNPQIKIAWQEVCTGLDQLLEGYGYRREGRIFKTPFWNQDKPYQDATIVIFCHLGVTLLMMSHLLGIAPPLLWQNFFIAPTSVTILASEERMEKEAYFRAQVVGDTLHLNRGTEPISRAGYFADPFHL